MADNKNAEFVHDTPAESIIVQVEPVSVKIDQAATMMGTSTETLRKWIDRAGFPCIRIGRRVIIPVAGMRQWADENTGKTINI